MIKGLMLISGLMIGSLAACTKTEDAQVVAAIQPVGACIVDVIMATQGVEDPAAIVTTCGGAIADVYQIVSELLAREPAVAPVDGGPVLTPEIRTHLMRIQRQCTHHLMTDAGTSSTP